MSRRPAPYHPYRPSVPLLPAGFRLRDYVPRRCFDLFEGLGFTDARSSDPSPTNGAQCLDDNAPPIIPLGDFLKSGLPKIPLAPVSEQCANPNPNPNIVPIKDSLPPPPRRKANRGPKHLSFKKDGSRSNIPPHRRSQQFKEKRESFRRKLRERHGRRLARSRSELSRLHKEARALMSSQRMNSEDRIFLEQLGNLEADHQMEDELEKWRERMARAARETDQRRREHNARDVEAAKLWEEKRDAEVVEEFVSGEDEEREALREEYFRHLEEEAMRADAERQRAHEAAEREIREAQDYRFHKELARKAEEQRREQKEQERLLRERERQRREEMFRRLQEEARQLREEKERKQREEMMRRLQEEAYRLREEVKRLRQAEREHRQRQEQERKLREEVERLRREAHERYLRDERERLAREQQARWHPEEARRSTMEEQIHQQFVLYEAKWNELRSNNAIPPIDVREMPWPVLGIISSADQITYQDVRAFLFHAQRPGASGKSGRDKVKSEVLRFHPDKFNTRIVPKIQYAHQTVAKEIAGAVARILTTIMNEEAEEQK